MNKKLLFFDIDGTLIDYHIGINTISPDTIATLDALKENGHDIFLATGRCKCFITEGVMFYPFSGYVTCNGGYVEYRDRPVYKAVVPAEAIKATVDLSNQHHFNFYFEANDKIYVRDRNDPKHQVFAKKWGMKDETIIDDFDPEEIETYIGMIIINEKSDEKLVVDALSPYFDVQRHRDWFSFDLTLKTTSKGIGIIKLVEALGYQVEDTIAFGDGRNDVEMLESVGLGIAMRNSMEEALAAADYITGSVKEEGITEACRHFGLID